MRRFETAWSRLSLVVGAALCTPACLQNDPRPPPGSVLVTASPDSVIETGVVTADGWQVDYQRFLVSLGFASAEDDEGTCNHTYSDPNYSRVLDMKSGHEQKLNLVFALGVCSIDLELSSPKEDSVLGQGATPADRKFMRTPESDDYVTDGGISIHLEATARKGSVEKRLSWSYRYRIDYTNIGTRQGTEVKRGFELKEHDELQMDVPILGGALFWDQLSGEGQLRFDAIAAADQNNDGEVALHELEAVPLASIADSSRYADGEAKGLMTLGAYVYKGLFQRVVDANAKEKDVFPNTRNPE